MFDNGQITHERDLTFDNGQVTHGYTSQLVEFKAKPQIKIITPKSGDEHLRTIIIDQAKREITITVEVQGSAKRVTFKNQKWCDLHGNPPSEQDQQYFRHLVISDYKKWQHHHTRPSIKDFFIGIKSAPLHN
jgi:hypothetical protein